MFSYKMGVCFGTVYRQEPVMFSFAKPLYSLFRHLGEDGSL